MQLKKKPNSLVNGDVEQLLPESIPDTPKTEQLHFPVWRVLALTTVIVGVVLTSLPSFMSCTSKAKQAEGKQNIAAMNRSQEAYYLENSTFSNSFDALGVGIQTQSRNYYYSIRPTKNAVFNSAIARQDDVYEKVGLGIFQWEQRRRRNEQLKSYVGAVFLLPATKSNPKVDKKEILTLSIVCQTLSPSQTRPTDPTLVKGVPTCGADTKDINPKPGI